MADIINLNKVRKAKQKQAKVEQAAENRILHGLSGQVKNLHQRIQKQRAAKIAQHKLDTPSTIKKVDDE
ncbi:MAG: DUF4169 family protein [Asticcacaulis sp.]